MSRQSNFSNPRSSSSFSSYSSRSSYPSSLDGNWSSSASFSSSSSRGSYGWSRGSYGGSRSYGSSSDSDSFQATSSLRDGYALTLFTREIPLWMKRLWPDIDEERLRKFLRHPEGVHVKYDNADPSKEFDVQGKSIALWWMCWACVQDGDVASLKQLLISPEFSQCPFGDATYDLRTWPRAEPLIIAAAKCGRANCIATLIDEFGCNPNVTGKNAGTPLHAAAYHGHPEAVRVLLAAGADRTLKKSYGWGECAETA